MMRERSDVREKKIESMLTLGIILQLCQKLCVCVVTMVDWDFSFILLPLTSNETLYLTQILKTSFCTGFSQQKYALVLYTCMHIESNVPGKCQMYYCCIAQMACACALSLVHSESIRFSRNMQTICAASIQKHDACFQKFQTCYISAVELCCKVTGNMSGISRLLAARPGALKSQKIVHHLQTSPKQNFWIQTPDILEKTRFILATVCDSYFVPAFLKILTSFTHLQSIHIYIMPSTSVVPIQTISYLQQWIWKFHTGDVQKQFNTSNKYYILVLYRQVEQKDSQPANLALGIVL